MFSRTTCMIANVKKIIGPDFLTQQIHFSDGTFYFPRETSHEEFVSRPLRVMHYASLMCIILHEKCTPTYANRRFLVLFFSARKKNYDRHVHGLGDLPFISLVCNRARSLKKNIFHTISSLGGKQRHSLKMKICKGTCSTCTVVSHS